MVISHRHKYLFVELPRSGTTAIGKELRTNYDGVRILPKHGTYYAFRKTATDEEKKYFVFSCIRNPMDDAVSRYFKIRSNHHARHTSAKALKRRWTAVERFENRLFNYVQETDADFATFFKKSYLFPYSTWANMDHQDFDFIIRFENLQDDFAQVLNLLNIEVVRPLPAKNKTGLRDRDFLSYYTPDTIGRARRVFGPFTRDWGYEFPPEWGELSVSLWDQMQYKCVTAVKTLYWRYLRYRI